MGRIRRSLPLCRIGPGEIDMLHIASPTAGGVMHPRRYLTLGRAIMAPTSIPRPRCLMDLSVGSSRRRRELMPTTAVAPPDTTGQLGSGRLGPGWLGLGWLGLGRLRETRKLRRISSLDSGFAVSEMANPETNHFDHLEIRVCSRYHAEIGHQDSRTRHQAARSRLPRPTAGARSYRRRSIVASVTACCGRCIAACSRWDRS